jgi:hypothetical protein
VPQSLHRTWSAIGIAALAVLFVAFLAGRDFARDVYPASNVSLESSPFDVEESAALVPVSLETTEPVPSSVPWFQPCTCGSIPFALPGAFGARLFA